MPTATPIDLDPQKPIDIMFVGQSPHVFVYRFWKKEPSDTKYIVIKDGDTVDTIPDNFRVGPYPDATRIAYWVGVGGKANSVYRFSVIFMQDGTVPAGGHQTHQGTTSAKGGAEVEHEVVLI
jgi:hypothetical protein